VLLALTLVRGALAAINQPARLTLVPSLLPREHLPAGLALNSLLFNLARFIGPAVAGVAIAAGGISFAFALNAVSYVVLLHALWVLDVPRATKPEVARGVRGTLKQAADGITYVRNSPTLAPILFMFAVVALCGRPVQELLPGFADDVFGRGAFGLALMTSAMGLGAMLGGYSIIRAASHAGLTGPLFVNYAVMCAALLIFAWTTLFWFGLLLLVVLGFTMAVNSICTQSLVQYAVDDAYRGRVMSLYGMIFRGFPAIGALAIGVAADVFGLALPLAAASLLMLVAWLPALRHRRQTQAQDPTRSSGID
jgi:predicted MFS family arabinose efflux permease